MRDFAASATRFSSSSVGTNVGTAMDLPVSGSFATNTTRQSQARVNTPSRGSAESTSLTMCMEDRPVIAMRERTSTMWPEGIGRVKWMWPTYAVTQYVADHWAAQA